MTNWLIIIAANVIAYWRFDTAAWNEYQRVTAEVARARKMVASGAAIALSSRGGRRL